MVVPPYGLFISMSGLRQSVSRLPRTAPLRLATCCARSFGYGRSLNQAKETGQRPCRHVQLPRHLGQRAREGLAKYPLGSNHLEFLSTLFDITPETLQLKDDVGTIDLENHRSILSRLTQLRTSCLTKDIALPNITFHHDQCESRRRAIIRSQKSLDALGRSRVQ